MAPEAQQPEGGKKEAKEVLRDNYALASNTRLLRLSVGNLPTVASTNMTEAEMETEASTLLRRTEFTNLTEVHRRGQLRATGNMIQHQASSEQLLRLKEAQSGTWQPGQEEQYKHHLSELIISSQAATLKRYMPEMAMELAQFMEMALQDLPGIAINLPGDKQKELYDMELVARQFLSQLRLMIRERVSYENVNAIQTQRAKIERDVWRLRFLMESAKQNDEYVKDNRATFDATHSMLSSASAGEENILLLRLRPTLAPLGNKEAMAALDAYSKRGATVAERLTAITALEKALIPTYANFDARREIYMKTLSPESKDALEIGKMRLVIKNRQDVVDRQEFAINGFMAIEPVMAKELEEREAKLWPVIRALKEEYMKPAKDQDKNKINALFAEREKLMGSLRYSYGNLRTMLFTVQSELDADDKRQGLEKMDREERDALENRRDILAYRLQMPLLVSQQVELDVNYKNTLPEIQKREDVYLTKRVESVRGKLAAITVDLDAEFQNQVGINTAEKKPALVIPAYYGSVKDIDKSVTRLFEVGKNAVDTDELKKQLDKSKAGRDECIKTMEEAVKTNKSEAQVRSLRAQITILKNRGDAEEDLLQYARLRKDPELRKGNADEPPFLAEHDAEKNLDQKMVWLMAGRGIESQKPGEKPVLPPNFWPQYMLTTALQYRYEQYLALETQLARVDSPLSKEQKEDMLRALNRARTAHMNKMLFVTAHLGDYQMRMAELIGIMEAQRGYTTEGSLDGTVRATPKKVKELLERGTQENFVFHVDRISAMAETAQNVFG
ncbi:MAG TPA: hypothetical protein PKV72_02600, partial [Candidatus Peribacteria bacterium]|nr:hypothetical protein [Candidatus Peribacteria bacterium]